MLNLDSVFTAITDKFVPNKNDNLVINDSKEIRQARINRPGGITVIAILCKGVSFFYGLYSPDFNGGTRPYFTLKVDLREKTLIWNAMVAEDARTRMTADSRRFPLYDVGSHILSVFGEDAIAADPWTRNAVRQQVAQLHNRATTNTTVQVAVATAS